MKFRNSMLSAADFCPTKYKLQYVDGIQEPGLLDPNLSFGTAIHLALQYHFSGYNPIDTFSDFWRTIDQFKYDWGASSLGYNDLYACGTELMRKWLKFHSKKYMPLHVEKKIDFKVGNFDFEGTPDFIGYYEDELCVLDWKTAAFGFDDRKPIVDSQLWLYTQATKQVYGLDVKNIVYAPLLKTRKKIKKKNTDGSETEKIEFATVQTPIIFEVTQKKLDEQISNVIIKCKDLSNRTEWPKNGMNCLKCRFFETCYGSM